MKYRFFLAYVPVMFIIGILLTTLADRYDGRAVVLDYQSNEFENINGEMFLDSAQEEADAEEEEFYNGRQLEDNGMPYCIKVNKTQNVVTVYEVGEDGYYSVPVKAMVCSVGEGKNTPNGVFGVGEKYQWLYLQGDVYGQYATGIIGNILFHSVPYHTQNKADLKVDEYNKLGEAASAGCIRLSVVDAKWIYDNCKDGTYVNIFESVYEGPLGKPVAAKIEKQDENWDPTDPDSESPYMGNQPVILGAYDRTIERASEFTAASGVTALDSVGNDITNRMQVNGEVDTEKCGTYQVTYSVVDDEGIYASKEVEIVVEDKEPPIIFLKRKVERIGASDAATVEQLESLLLQNVVAYDGKERLGKDAISIDYSEIEEKGYGECTVRYCASDEGGNQSDFVEMQVEVDLEVPKLELKESAKNGVRISRLQQDDYLLGLVEASDNSGQVEVTLSRPLTYAEGEPYKVMYCAKDGFGNVTTMSVTYQIKE